MKNLLRVAAMLLCLVMVFGTVGCAKSTTEYESVWVGEDGQTIWLSDGTPVTGNDGTTSGGTTSGGKTDGKTESGTTSGGTTSGGKTDTSNAKDFGGATLTLGHWSANQDVMNPATTAPHYASYQKLISSIEKKYNCKVKYNNGANSMQYWRNWTTAAMAGSKFADIAMMGSSWVYPNDMLNGFIHPLDNYLNLKESIWSQSHQKQLAVNGKNYAAVQAQSFRGTFAIWFNKKLFDKWGIDYPYEYIKKNNWNWDTFKEICVKATKKEGGIQYYGFGGSGRMASVFAAANGGSWVTKKNGKYIFNMDAPEYINAVQYLQDLFKAGQICSSGAAAEWTSGKIAMYCDDYYVGGEFASLGQENIGYAYPPIGKDNKDGKYHYMVYSIPCFIMPSTVKNPTLVGKVMRELLYPYKWYPTVEQQLENNFYDEKSLEIAVDISVTATKEAMLLPSYDYTIESVGWSSFGLYSTQSPQAYAESVKAKCQAEIDAMWKQ